MPLEELVLLLGGNMGDPPAELDKAQDVIGATFGGVLARSRDHWSEPWGFTDPGLFLNRALVIGTAQPLEEVMHELLRIEVRQGRTRTTNGKPGPRIIDIDILSAGPTVMRSDHLILPHPRMDLRRFALAPMADVAPTWLHPTLQRTTLQLLNALPVG
ncbi:MAG: 2-amino-4-hydroxy-6-hydroxymethyldihydropteridine diphosphokinase [Flavobacteriales bacterium]|nr:2-amino-4-hydroxy-6-hydroxymethyldihydropteridine diphosphokinase [Flavobacteriales bacterium]MBP6642941.1 2-amino-4-hydroxy-6-hydroxymethyldihydropteridine diphosphokinase [Flavobacteriales bacterium]MBP7154842.1 2-amino-4-hydroxy-6-hydroxymethyldihydropteridine diphosphokinase [Flavobacteriales bacterium]HQV75802.1 2-amino-4-hydroxy-6-hydroxymethyldihydropteridine diphosphokinase [Flavobacteriales bacterium]HQW41489.1 2-amino-4-hydroxy-6-hydroxymethyldihydropteridine diphosphokinase [Flavo